jgi:dynein heavy chain 1
VQNIQIGLKKNIENPDAQIEMVGRQLKVHKNTGKLLTTKDFFWQ